MAAGSSASWLVSERPGQGRAQATHVELSGADERVNQGTLAERADEDGVRGEARRVGAKPWPVRRDALDVRRQVARRDLHDLEVVGRHDDVRHARAAHKLEV